MQENKPFWKVPMMWLVIGLPLASVVAGLSLLAIAIRSGGADVVRDDVQRVSQIQTADLGADGRARELRLSAVLRADDGVLQVIPATGDFDAGATLRLVLAHPTRAIEDIEVELPPADGGWQVRYALDDSHDWLVELASAEGGWRLRGRLPRQQHATRLAPALAQ
ncbi:nitrogen fixation protein FixH [Luteimonas aestuarii]|uniref:Nitrogen fixation protein FixH n=1 Tax=Luteimonas aestuarii TaxID=453837 RepID=A0A4R5TV59_9GAMM|nr:FixH family protein [Luteimonas aestuarii]TDK24967.1 nitrogen fixation protein FixH [Luteimonas aestuarii]